jgi:hypothetical protein
MDSDTVKTISIGVGIGLTVLVIAVVGIIALCNMRGNDEAPRRRRRRSEAY